MERLVHSLGDIYMIVSIGNEEDDVFEDEVKYRTLIAFFIHIINRCVSFQTIFNLFFGVVILSFSFILSVR